MPSIDVAFATLDAALLALLAGLACGALNGFLIAYVGLPSLAVTIGTLALFRGIAVGLLGTKAVTDFTEKWSDMATDTIGDTPLVRLNRVTADVGATVVAKSTAPSLSRTLPAGPTNGAPSMSSRSHRPSGSSYSMRASGKWTCPSSYGRSCSRAHRAISSGSRSSRSPRNRGWRKTRSRVHSVNSTSATSSGEIPGASS